jgi:hypothetical protein
MQHRGRCDRASSSHPCFICSCQSEQVYSEPNVGHGGNVRNTMNWLPIEVETANEENYAVRSPLMITVTALSPRSRSHSSPPTSTLDFPFSFAPNDCSCFLDQARHLPRALAPPLVPRPALAWGVNFDINFLFRLQYYIQHTLTGCLPL